MRRLVLLACLSTVHLAAGCVASGSDDNRYGPSYPAVTPSADAGRTGNVDLADAGVNEEPLDGDAEATSDGSVKVVDGAGIDVANGSDAGEAGPSTDAASEASSDAAIEAGADVSVPDAGGCGSLAVVGGGASSTVYAASDDGGPWSIATSAGAVLAPPAAVFTGGSDFHSIFRGAVDALRFARRSGGFWTPSAPIGTALAASAPSLVAGGGSLFAVYRGTNSHFYIGTYSAAWDAADTPVGPAQLRSFGPSPPSAAWASGKLVFAQAGADGALYVRTYNAGWLPAEVVPGAETPSGTATHFPPPTLVALQGAAADLLCVYPRRSDYKLMFVLRTAGVWSVPALVHADAYTTDAVAVAALDGGRALLAFRGADFKPYVAEFAPAGNGAWSPPGPLVSAAQPVLTGLPAVAKGVCGDRAVVAYPTGSGLQVTRLRAQGWSVPEVLLGTSGANQVAVASGAP